MRRFYQSLLFKMMVRSALVIGFSILLMELISYRMSSTVIENLTKESILSRLESHRERITTRLDYMQSSIIDFKAIPSINEYFTNKSYDLDTEAEEALKGTKQYFKNIYTRNKKFIKVALLDDKFNSILFMDNGRFVSDIQTKKFLDQNPVKLEVDSSAPIRSFYRSLNGTKNVLAYVTQITMNDSIVGYILLGTELDKLLADITSDRIFKTGKIGVHTSEGAIIHYNGSSFEGHSFEDLDIKDIKNKVVEFNKNGIDNILFTLNVVPVGWTLFAKVNKDEFYFDILKIRKVITALILFCIFIEFSLVTIFLKKLILNPLNSLLNLSREVANNNLDFKLDIKNFKNDEVHKLAESLQAMVASLKEEKIRNDVLNRDLEQRVILKTEELKQEQMRSYNAAKLASLGEMAGGIAHEINNPLTIISTTMSYIRKMIKKDMVETDDFREALDDVDQTVIRITKIVSGLRNLTRDTTNEDFEECRVEDLLQDTLALSSEKFKSHGVDFEVQISEKLKVKRLSVMRVQISQVLLNLLSNAYDEILTDKEKWVKLIVEEKEGFVIFKVMDSGKGISTEIREKIFQPFFTTKDFGKGTGLGLSLAHSIIKRHNGVLSIDNDCSNTCFVFSIPT